MLGDARGDSSESGGRKKKLTGRMGNHDNNIYVQLCEKLKYRASHRSYIFKWRGIIFLIGNDRLKIKNRHLKHFFFLIDSRAVRADAGMSRLLLGPNYFGRCTIRSS